MFRDDTIHVGRQLGDGEVGTLCGYHLYESMEAHAMQHDRYRGVLGMKARQELR